jgi:hypothetical protein
MGGSELNAFVPMNDVPLGNDAIAMLKQALGGGGGEVSGEEIEIFSDGAEMRLDVESEGQDSRSPGSSSLMDVMKSMKLSLEGLTSSAINKLSSIIGRPQLKKVTIPSVMISKQHGARLLRIMDHLAEKGRHPQIRLDTDVLPSALDSVLNEGNADATLYVPRSSMCDGVDSGGVSRSMNRYPKIVASSKSIRIISSKPWGVVIAKNPQNLWELRIFGRGDVDALLVREATFEGSDGTKSLGSFIQNIPPNQVELYSLLMNRQCSTEVDPGPDKIVIKKRMNQNN